jgi:hypothetical protein
MKFNGNLQNFNLIISIGYMLRLTYWPVKTTCFVQDYLHCLAFNPVLNFSK